LGLFEVPSFGLVWGTGASYSRGTRTRCRFGFLRSLTQAQLDLFINVSMLADNSGPTRLHQKDRRQAEADLRLRLSFCFGLGGLCLSWRRQSQWCNSRNGKTLNDGRDDRPRADQPSTIGAAMTDLTVISEGASGQTVEWAQYLLYCQIAYLTYRQIDGIFGPQTTTATKRFQHDRNLTADGVIGPDTWAALGGSSPQPPTLTQGAHGPLVGKLQATLNFGRGHWVPDSEPVLAVDSYYGPLTAAVVRGAQRHGGIPVDGQVGLQTWALPIADIALSLSFECGLTGLGGI
jgi:hypothetical protein